MAPREDIAEPRQAPELQTSEWLNTPEPITLASLRGKVVLVHAFQMLCPGCVARGIPQAQRVAELFAGAPLVVLGLHAVFEHHDAMGPTSLRAFLHEYRVRFPVGIDVAGPKGETIPRTMMAYGMRGTPTTILIDARGRIRGQHFGVHEDVVLGAEMATLLGEAGRDAIVARPPVATMEAEAGGACSPASGCAPSASRV